MQKIFYKKIYEYNVCNKIMELQCLLQKNKKTNKQPAAICSTYCLKHKKEKLE